MRVPANHHGGRLTRPGLSLQPASPRGPSAGGARAAPALHCPVCCADMRAGCAGPLASAGIDMDGHAWAHGIPWDPWDVDFEFAIDRARSRPACAYARCACGVHVRARGAHGGRMQAAGCAFVLLHSRDFTHVATTITTMPRSIDGRRTRSRSSSSRRLQPRLACMLQQANDRMVDAS